MRRPFCEPSAAFLYTSLRNVWETTGCPAESSGVWKVMFRIISETVLVGIRTESAMNPTCLICGRTCSKAFAEPVVDTMMLFMIERFLRRSDADALGGASGTFCV